MDSATTSAQSAPPAPPAPTKASYLWKALTTDTHNNVRQHAFVATRNFQDAAVARRERIERLRSFDRIARYACSPSRTLGCIHFWITLVTITTMVAWFACVFMIVQLDPHASEETRSHYNWIAVFIAVIWCIGLGSVAFFDWVETYLKTLEEEIHNDDRRHGRVVPGTDWFNDQISI